MPVSSLLKTIKIAIDTARRSPENNTAMAYTVGVACKILKMQHIFAYNGLSWGATGPKR